MKVRHAPLFLSGTLAATALLVISLTHGSETDQIADYRTIDGSNNNAAQPDLGKAHTPLIRFADASYGDSENKDLPRGVPVDIGDDGIISTSEQTLPSGRRISNTVHDQGDRNIPNSRKLNQLFFQFGQFLSHDTGLSEPDGSIATGGTTGLAGNESFNVEVESSDPDFGFSEIPLTRSIAEAATAAHERIQINAITTFIDGSNVYGSDSTRASALRSFVGGRMATQSGIDGDLMPYNSYGLSYANPLGLPQYSLFAGGDVRCNEQVGLISFHILFLREHNRLASEIAARDFPGADLTDPMIDEEIYQRARAVVAALLQKITYHEWLPALLGTAAISDYQGYDPNLDPSIANEFSTAAFRIGHTLLPPAYAPIADDGSTSSLPLLFAFFNPSYISTNGISALIRGQAHAPQQQLDRFIVDGVRNFLFGPGFGGLDLASLNLQRGRDHGIPSYNDTRIAMGLAPKSDFLEVTGGDELAAQALADAYGAGGIDDLDLWSGGLCETHLPYSTLGETFTALFVEQFVRLRDGDRFYFENRDIYSEEFIKAIFDTTFTDVIRRNTTIQDHELNGFAFFLPGYNPHQPDLRIGRGRNRFTHRGDDIYNFNAARQTISMHTSKRRWAKSYLSVENDGAYRGAVSVRSNRIPRRRFINHYFDFRAGFRRNVTGQLLSGRFTDGGAPSSTVVESRVRSRTQHRRSRAHLRLLARSKVETGAVDVNRQFVWFR